MNPETSETVDVCSALEELVQKRFPRGRWRLEKTDIGYLCWLAWEIGGERFTFEMVSLVSPADAVSKVFAHLRSVEFRMGNGWKKERKSP